MSDRAEAPTAWTLQASTDGTTWKPLDRRSGESFTWDRQTRAFSIPAPSAYRHYRLVLDETATLAEVELLAWGRRERPGTRPSREQYEHKGSGGPRRPNWFDFAGR